MDIANLTNINSVSMVEAYNKGLTSLTATATTEQNSAFDSLLSAALTNINATNAYLGNAREEEIKWALGESTSTHDLTNALQKASVALQYTVAIRDKILEAYREIMQMQI
ncbi:MAG: flagellar hook-basal body complex protein FliE [Lachnospiraceae bacterium]|jgi:flagellar hook-basal body complex protein FliE|nr:flagellar hook-basal body complex protein FliE [Lachnospiraceae bacterium]